MTVIEIRDYRVAEHGDATGVSLTVPAGASVGIVGVDQVALTKLIRACAGLDPAPAGTIWVAGVDVGAADRHELLALRKKMGYVSIGGGLLSNMTLRQNIELVLRYHDVGSEGVVRDRAEALLAEVGLATQADRRASILPAELQKCAAYVRALASDPQVFLVEDPSASLHPHGRAAIERLHQLMRAREITVLVADDDVTFADCLVDRLHELRGGSLYPLQSGQATLDRSV